MRKPKWALAILISLLFVQFYCVPIASHVSASASSDDWPMFHHDPTHTGYTTSTGPTTTPVLIWSTQVSGQVFNFPFQTVVNGVVYVSTGSLYAFNASTGDILWSVVNGGACVPVVYGDYVYAGAAAPTAYNASTGAQIWNYTTGNGVNSSPAIAGGVVYVGSGDGNLYALNAYTGAKIWNYTVQSEVESFGPASMPYSPAIVNGCIYMGSDNYTILVLGTASNTTSSPSPSPSPTTSGSSPSPSTPLSPLQLTVIVVAVVVVVLAVVFFVYRMRRKEKNLAPASH